MSSVGIFGAVNMSNALISMMYGVEFYPSASRYYLHSRSNADCLVHNLSDDGCYFGKPSISQLEGLFPGSQCKQP